LGPIPKLHDEDKKDQKNTQYDACQGLIHLSLFGRIPDGELPLTITDADRQDIE
jgi:hypothetical protein